jgi:hypothetical protein
MANGEQTKMQVRLLERAGDLRPTVFAYDTLTGVVRFDSFLMCLMGFASYQGFLFLLSPCDETFLFSLLSCGGLCS